MPSITMLSRTQGVRRHFAEKKCLKFMRRYSTNIRTKPSEVPKNTSFECNELIFETSILKIFNIFATVSINT